MSKKSTGGNSNMLLLAGLGVGAFMLFANKSNAQSKSPTADATASGDSGDEIPAAPKILAVNQSSTESPAPTGIVSDEEGMEATGAKNTDQTGDDDPESGEEGASQSGSLVNMAVSAGSRSINIRQAQSDDIPPLISTTLTAREKYIIDQGVLSDALAIQRPDLYKAIYIRKHGKNGNGQKALQAADTIIQNIQAKGNSAATAHQKKRRKVKIKLHPNSGNMVKAAAQTGGGFAAIAALSTINAAQYANSGNAPAKKPVHRIGSKGAHAHSKPVHHTTAHHPASKHPVHRHKATTHPKH